jgi:hypothetical protein
MPIPTHSHFVLEFVHAASATGMTIHFPSLLELCTHLARTHPAWAPTIATWLDAGIASGTVGGILLSIWRVDVDTAGYRVPVALFPPRPPVVVTSAIRVLAEVR